MGGLAGGWVTVLQKRFSKKGTYLTANFHYFSSYFLDVSTNLSSKLIFYELISETLVYFLNRNINRKRFSGTNNWNVEQWKKSIPRRRKRQLSNSFVGRADTLSITVTFVLHRILHVNSVPTVIFLI